MGNYSSCKATQEAFGYLQFLLEKILDRPDNGYVPLLCKLHEEWRVDLFNPALPEAARFTNRLPPQVWTLVSIETPRDIEALVNGGSMLHNSSYGNLLRLYGSTPLVVRDADMFDQVCKEMACFLEEAVYKPLPDSRKIISDCKQEVVKVLHEQHLAEILHLV